MTHAAGRMNMPSFVLMEPWREAIKRFDIEVSEDLVNAPRLLRNVPLAVFGATLLATATYYPRAQEFLPKMASDLIQTQWTGSTGTVLLETSLAFMSHLVVAAGGAEKLSTMQVLDFGVGWGRISRLFLKYMPPSQLDCCDAWDVSLELAKECGLQNKITKSNPYLDDLPANQGAYDMIYACSIFTHLSEKAFRGSLAGFSKLLAKDGKAVFTVRPNLFWSLRPDLAQQSELLKSKNFEFVASNGLVDFGDTSVGIEWFQSALADAGLKLTGLEWSPVDALQVVAITQRV
jgi:2-polyprenyl-3-methyl-5-hydroxy-6-metoxy-1,4-benzoquinol methylase